MSTRYRRIYKALAPSWLTTGDGELALYSLGLMMDGYAERVRLSLLARFPSYCPDDAVGAMGRDRKIIRGVGETAAAYATRMLTWLDLHKVRGTPYALHDQIRAYLQADVKVTTVDRRGNWFTTAVGGARSSHLDLANWDWDGDVITNWSRFWVIIDSSSGVPWTTDGVWGAGTGAWGDAGVFGFSATTDQIASLRAIIRDWKPANAICEWIVVSFNAAAFIYTAPLVAGNYGNWSEYDVATETQVPVRSTFARYVKGSL